MMDKISEISVPDDFPVRPTNVVQTELQRRHTVTKKKRIITTILLSFTFLIFGMSVGLYGPLYPMQADFHEVPSYIYGVTISSNFFIAVLFYPVASMMVSSITCKQSMCSAMVVIGCCKVLFGLLALVSQKLYFIILSFAIQIVEGIGIAVLLVSTFIVLFSLSTERTKSNNTSIMICTALGICIGPVYGEVCYKAFDFSIPFYGIGVLCVLLAIFLAIFLPEPGQRLTHKDVPIVTWMKEPGLLIYVFMIFSTFNYTGFLTVILEPYLRQFHLKSIFIGMLFSLPSFACGLFSMAWKWLTQKGVNSLLLACIASFFTFASLILFVPARFTSLDQSLRNISISLLLQGIGTGGKLACIIFAAHRDIYSKRRIKEISNLHLYVPTMFAFGTCTGYFIGSSVASVTLYFFGLKVSSYFLYCLETLSVALVFVFAFKRNYRSPRHILLTDEGKPILRN